MRFVFNKNPKKTRSAVFVQEGAPMLHWAARNDYQRMAALLISHGVDLEAKDNVLAFLSFKGACLVTSSLCI